MTAAPKPRKRRRRGDVHRLTMAALEGVPDNWQTALAETLAITLDTEPNASIARELRALMKEITEADPAAEDDSADDEFTRRRNERLAAAEAAVRAAVDT